MSRGRFVTPSRTAERVERVRKLITALRSGPLTRDEVGGLLSLSPPAVRKYMVDLNGVIETFGEFGHPMCRLSDDSAKVDAYLAKLDEQAVSRPAKPRKCELSIAAQDPARHFHIMEDDVEFKVRVPKGIPAHHPLMAAFFNLVPSGVWA
jgi:predicted transcriptional regulator